MKKKILRIIERIFQSFVVVSLTKESSNFFLFIIFINMQTASSLSRVLCETNYKNWPKSSCWKVYAFVLTGMKFCLIELITESIIISVVFFIHLTQVAWKKKKLYGGCTQKTISTEKLPWIGSKKGFKLNYLQKYFNCVGPAISFVVLLVLFEKKKKLF